MKNIELEQGSQEWLEFRKSHIGGSDIAAILGISPFKSAYQLWLEKTGRETKEGESNYFMIRGRMLEEDARLLYSELTGNLIIPSIKISSEWEVAMASLDGINMEEDLICEIKCPSQKNFAIYSIDGVPKHYYAQIQWQLMITGAQKCDFFVYVDKDNHHTEGVFPDPDYQKILMKAAKEFWDMVESNTAPELDEKDHLYIEDEEANKLAQQWRELKEEEERIKAEEKELEKQMLEFTDDGNCIFSLSGVRLTRINRKGNIDWEKVCVSWNIPDEEIDRFRKKGIGYTKFSRT